MQTPCFSLYCYRLHILLPTRGISKLVWTVNTVNSIPTVLEAEYAAHVPDFSLTGGPPHLLWSLPGKTAGIARLAGIWLTNMSIGTWLLHSHLLVDEN